MNFRTQLPDLSSHSKIQIKDHLLLMGSCFTQHMGNRLCALGISAEQNPFGIAYHPSAIFSQLKRLCEGRPFERDEEVGCIIVNWLIRKKK